MVSSRAMANHRTAPGVRSPIPQPAVFLDRDGTLIKEVEYLSEVEQVKLIKGAGESVRKLNRAGWPVVLVTNQSGVARGMFSEERVGEVHARLTELLEKKKAFLDGIYFCPHHPQFGSPCACRKPEPGMGLKAAQELKLDLPLSYMVGDKVCDLQFGVALGCTPILVETGHGAEALATYQGIMGKDAKKVEVFPDLKAAVASILEKAAAAAQD